jgi:epoxyqueuosine reductase
VTLTAAEGIMGDEQNHPLEKLTSAFAALNARFRIVSVVHLEDCRERMEKLRSERLIGERLYAEYLSFFQFRKPETLLDSKSIIIIAIPQASSTIDVEFHGQHHRVIIPPTYVYKEIREACTKILSEALSRTGAGVVRAYLPLKLLAVRSGLGKYGRNNICYVDSMGSFHRLEAFHTDCDFGVDDWQEMSMMGSCIGCSLCIEACPIGCISSEKIFVDAERCLTYLNENKEDFPEWVNPRWHNAIVGCMRCQASCPENRDFVRDRNKVEKFSEEETELILKPVPVQDLPKELSDKLARLNMDEPPPFLARNLAALLRM